MYLKIKQIEAVCKPDVTFIAHLEVTSIGLYSDEGKFLRFVEMNEKLIETLMNAKIKI